MNTEIPLPKLDIDLDTKRFNVNEEKDDILNSRLTSPDYDKRLTGMHDLEKALLLNQSTCPIELSNQMKVHAFQLDDFSIIGSMKTYDHKFQDSFACLAGTLIDQSKNRPDARLLQWKERIALLNNQGAMGTVFDFITENGSLFLIKVNRESLTQGKPIEAFDLVHEGFIGLSVINPLRDRVPNFMHTYGAFFCAPPIIEDGVVKVWCPTQINDVAYLLIENIRNSIQLRDAITENKITAQECVQVFLQVMNALNIAYQANKFTHYDLHDANILLQFLEQPIWIPIYLSDGSIKYVVTKILARIIDYGFSYAEVQGTKFGTYDYENASVYPDRPFPMHDAHKLIYSMRKTTKNQSLIRNLSNIYDFFGSYGGKSLHNFVEENKLKFNYYGQPSPKSLEDALRNVTYQDMIDYLLEKFPDMVQNGKPSNAIASICEDKCVNWEIFQELVFDGKKLPINISEYCDTRRLIDELVPEPDRTKSEKWLNNFNIHQAFRSESGYMSEILDEITELLSDLIKRYFKPRNDTLFISFLEGFLQYVYKLETVKLWLQSVMCAFDTSEKFQKIEKSFNSMRDKINDIEKRFQVLKKLLGSLPAISRDPRILKMIESIFAMIPEE